MPFECDIQLLSLNSVSIYQLPYIDMIEKNEYLIFYLKGIDMLPFLLLNVPPFLFLSSQFENL